MSDGIEEFFTALVIVGDRDNGDKDIDGERCCGEDVDDKHFDGDECENLYGEFFNGNFFFDFARSEARRCIIRIGKVEPEHFVHLENTCA